MKWKFIPIPGAALLTWIVLGHAVAGSAFGANSKAYVSLTNTPGAITPFDSVNATLGTPFFVPAYGLQIVVDPHTKQVWETVSSPLSGDAIYVLNPITGVTLATIPLSFPLYPVDLIIDAKGKYAYLSTTSQLLQIDVTSRTIVKTLNIDFTGTSGLALSGDGSKLFVAGTNSVAVLDSQSLNSVASLSLPEVPLSLLVANNTLLVLTYTHLIYFSTATLQQTNDIAVNKATYFIGATSANLYLTYDCLCGATASILKLDFATGQVLLTQDFADGFAAMLSPDGSKVFVLSFTILVLDANSLSTLKTIPSPGPFQSMARLTSSSTLLLNYALGGGGGIAVVDQASAQVASLFPLTGSPYSSIVPGAHGGAVYTSTYGGEVNVIDTHKNAVTTYLPNTENFFPTAEAGSKLFGGTSSYDLKTGTEGTLALPTPPEGYTFFIGLGSAPPDGYTYWLPFSLEYDPCPLCDHVSGFPAVEGGIFIYDAATGVLKADILSTNIILDMLIAFSPDSSTAYIQINGELDVYKLSNLQKVASFTYPNNFYSLVVSNDGTTLYASEDNLVHLLDAATGMEKQTFTVPGPIPYYGWSEALSADGSTLFLWQDGTKMYLMNTATGQSTAVDLPYPAWDLAVVPSD